MVTTRADFWSGTTAWARRFKSPLREFLRTEGGGAAVLLAATAAALVWVNVDASSYERLWGGRARGRPRRRGARADTAQVGEQRADDVVLLRAGSGGSARVRPRRPSRAPAVRAPVAGVGRRHGRRGGDLPRVQPRELGRRGLGHRDVDRHGVRAGIAHAGRPAGSGPPAGVHAHGRRRGRPARACRDRARLQRLDRRHASDLGGRPVRGGAGLLLGLKLRRGPPYFVLGSAMWVVALESGIAPLAVGLAFGLLAWAPPAARSDLEHAGKRSREFREQPTPELQHMARESIRTAISPNERLQLIYHPWTSYVIVPLFALANAGIAIDGAFLERAARSPITLGVLVGYVAGKPLGIVGTALLVTRLSHGRLRPTAGWGAVAGAGASAGVGFTVSLFVATLAFDGARLEEAKAGILAAPVGAAAVTWLVFRAIGLLSQRRRIAALLGGAEPLLDLEFAVDPESDHIRGPLDAPVTVVEYGDFECPYCGGGEPEGRELLRDFADVRYVWRHLPLADVHPHAELAALASEAAADQGAFWEMHDQLLEHQDKLRMADLVSYADRLGLDVARFTEQLQGHAGANRIAQDVEGANVSHVSGTPTFFINGRRHHDAYDIDTLSRAQSAPPAPATLAAS